MSETDLEAVETPVNDDAEKASLKPVSEARAAIPRAKASTRTGRAAQSKGAAVPADHKTAKATLEAQRREAQDEDGLVTATYNGETFTYDPDLFNFEFQLLCEEGRPLVALRSVLGVDQLTKCRSWHAREIQSFMQALTEAAGLGNS